MTILEELANRNIIQASQIPEIVNTANVKYNGNIDQVLLSLNIDESQILEVKSALYNIPAREVDPETVAVSTLQLIPRETANIYHFVPIGMTDDVLEIGITDGENVQTIDVLTFITAKMNKPFKLFLIKMSVYNKLLEKYDALGSEVEQVLSELDSEIAGVGDKDVIVDKKTSSETASSGIEDKIIEDAPIIKIVAVVLRLQIFTSRMWEIVLKFDSVLMGCSTHLWFCRSVSIVGLSLVSKFFRNFVLMKNVNRKMGDFQQKLTDTKSTFVFQQCHHTMERRSLCVFLIQSAECSVWKI
jgi:hypothetical protein